MFALPYLVHSRMATNESATIAICKQYALAQDNYRRVDHDGNGVLEYAKSLKELFDAGKIDADFAQAEFGPDAIPKDGYFFKVLRAQGPAGPGGARSYINPQGSMTIGYALEAFPAYWDQSGRNTFMISSSGTIYQKDLGGDTLKIASETTEFEPLNSNSCWICAE